VVRDIRSHPGFPEESGVGEADVLRVELSAHFSRTNLVAVEEIIENTVRRRVHDDAAMGALVQVCALFGSVSNAFEVLEHQLRAKTNHVGALANKGVLLSQLGRYDEALSTLNRALSIQTNNHGLLLNRAITLLLAGRLDEAQQDYETLARVFPNQHQVYYGLAEVALRKEQTNTAIGYLERYLTNAPVSRESMAVRERLKALKEPAP
jgi:tetratricopeptide (TPR) repeat protein